MKVKELVEQLKAVDQEIEVVVDGYEGGYDDPVIDITTKAYKRDWDGLIYFGKYDDDPTDCDPSGFKCVRIGRYGGMV